MLLLLAGLAQAELPPDALTALRRGDCGNALVLLADRSDLEAALAKARCGQSEQLGDQLDEGGVLEPYARLLVARDRLESDPAAAESLLAGQKLPGSAGLELRMVRARAQIAQGRSLEARPDLRALLSTSAKAEALYWLAVGAEDRGETEAAISAHRSNWSENVRSPFSLKSGERLAALGAPAPDTSSQEGQELALKRARALVKAYRAPEAIPLYDALTEANGRTDGAWTHELAMALFKAKEYPRAMETLGRLDPMEPGTKGGADTLYHYALGTSRTGDYGAAAVYYARLVELYPGTKLADTAQYKLGYLDYDEGQLETAIPKLQAYLSKHPRGEHADEAWWFLGWSLYRLDRLEESEAAFDKLLAAHSGSSLAPQALYWKARIQGRQGNEAGETASLERLVSGYPVSGHAWFASERLGRSFAGIGPVQIPPIPEAVVASSAELQAALALAGAGQWDWARERMEGAIPAERSKETSLALAHALIDVGAYKKAQELARPYCAKPWRAAEAPVATTACYPRPEAPVVAQATAAGGLEPLLPYAIMTAESALDPSVTSWAGARGLMQLMPELAEGVHAGLLPNDPYDPDRLYVAGYNAWLGTTELTLLYSQFEDSGVSPHLPLAIAGYNGGADAVQRWLDGYGEPPEVDWFAENISYSETRRYVRRVLGYLMTYRWIYGDQPAE
jgi:soluble lytic murein transglycosylase